MGKKPSITCANSFFSRTTTAPGGCVEWGGSIQSDGYGTATFRSKFWLAHRLAWTLTNGPIPVGMCVCHKCDNPRCCNPNHLFLGSHSDNMADMRRKGRRKGVNTKERNGRARLSEEQVAMIRSLYKRGEVRQVDLAARFSISQCMISAIVRGVNWK